MALADPANTMVTLFLVILLPVIVIYWIVRLAVRHELKRRKAGSFVNYLVILRVRMPQIRSTV
jgi:flagellar biogenesis protein FliO